MPREAWTGEEDADSPAPLAGRCSGALDEILTRHDPNAGDLGSEPRERSRTRAARKGCIGAPDRSWTRWCDGVDAEVAPTCGGVATSRRMADPGGWPRLASGAATRRWSPVDTDAIGQVVFAFERCASGRPPAAPREPCTGRRAQLKCRSLDGWGRCCMTMQCSNRRARSSMTAENTRCPSEQGAGVAWPTRYLGP